MLSISEFRIEVPGKVSDPELDRICMEIYDAMVSHGIYEKTFDPDLNKTVYLLTEDGEELFRETFCKNQ